MCYLGSVLVAYCFCFMIEPQQFDKITGSKEGEQLVVVQRELGSDWVARL